MSYVSATQPSLAAAFKQLGSRQGDGSLASARMQDLGGNNRDHLGVRTPYLTKLSGATVGEMMELVPTWGAFSSCAPYQCVRSTLYSPVAKYNVDIRADSSHSDGQMYVLSNSTSNMSDMAVEANFSGRCEQNGTYRVSGEVNINIDSVGVGALGSATPPTAWQVAVVGSAGGYLSGSSTVFYNYNSRTNGGQDLNDYNGFSSGWFPFSADFSCSTSYPYVNMILYQIQYGHINSSNVGKETWACPVAFRNWTVKKI